MPRSSSCSTGSSPWPAASLRLALALAAVAAAVSPATVRGDTVLSRRVQLAFDPAGVLDERVALQVRLDEARDLEDWSPYPIPLDENDTLVSASGWALRPDGSRVILHDDDVTTVEGWSEPGVVHSSARARLLRFPPLPAGSVLQVAYEMREEPWLESASIPLLAGDAPEKALEIDVSGAGDGFRWRIEPQPAEPGGSGAGPFQVTERRGGLVLRATGVEAPERDRDPRPVLRIAWGAARTWAGVGRWYEGLVKDVPRGSEPVRAAALKAVQGAATPRDRLAALTELVRRSVRYVAVEMGVGGYRPTPPAEVLERRWGDCKDKSLLLVDLLADVGIEAHPALVRLDEDRGVDPDFPAADRFNHLIVAVPAGQVAARPADAVAGGYLFVDPTQEMGGLAWLHPALQGQRALVVRGDASELATVPVLADRETRELSVHLTVSDGGDAAGQAELRLAGAGAWALARSTATASPQHLGAVATNALHRLLPGAELATPRWRQGDVDGVPRVEISASLRIARLVEGAAVRSLALPVPGAFPEPSELEGLQGPLAVRPVHWTTSWELELPAAWCRPPPSDKETSNAAGRFRQAVTVEADGGLRVERHSDLDVRWIGPDLAPAARKLSLSEHRAARRRLILRCDGGT